MARTLDRLLNIRPAEWPRVGWLYAMLLVSLIGTAWGETIVEAGFLRLVGVQYLPLLISASALVQILAMGIYTVFADRVADDRLLLVIVGASAAAIAAGLVLLAQGLIVPAYPLLYLVSAVALRFTVGVHWTTYVNGFYDMRAAKRIVPVLGSAARLAGIVGGLTMPLLTAHLAPAGIIALWLLALLAMMGLLWGMPRALHDAAGGRARPAAADQNPLDSMRTGYRFVRGSAYLRWLALATFLMMVLLAYLNYEGGKVLLEQLGTVQGIADFTGLLTGVANLLILPFQLFLFSRLIGRIGLGNSALLFPAATALSTVGLLLAPGLGTAAVAYLDRTTLRTTIFTAVDSLLYNAVPLRLRGRARAFVTGLVVPIGTLCGGLLLSLWSGLALRGPAAWFWPALMGVIALAYLASSWFVRRHYAQALVTMLEHDDLSFLVQQTAPDIAVGDPAAGKYLQDRLARPGPAPEMAVFLAQLLIQTAGPTALEDVAEAAAAAKDGSLRSRLVAVVATADGQNRDTAACLARFLADPDPRVRRAAVGGVAGLAAADGGEFCAPAEKLLADGDPGVRAEALAALAAAPGFTARPAAVAELERLLASADPAVRSQGLALAGRVALRSGEAAGLARLLAALAEPDDQVRLAAALALEAYCSERPAARAASAPAFMPAIHDPVERIRSAAVAVLGPSQAPAAPAALCEALRDPSPAVRSAAADALARHGRAAVPVVQPLLAASDPGLRAMAAVILARSTPRAYRRLLLGTYLAEDLRTIYRDHTAASAVATYRANRGAALLAALVEEQNQVRLAECFFLLSGVCPPAALETIRGSLSSRQRSRRAGAAEALEALITPQLARGLALWCDPERSEDRLQELAQAAWGLSPPDPPGALAMLLARRGDPWLHAAARYAWCEVAAAGTDVPLEPPAAEEEKMLAIVERVIFLKEVSFFQDMTVEQLRIMAAACEEELYPAGACIFSEGDAGGVLYVVVSGRVALEQEKRKGSFARLATIEAGSYFGEMNLFDNSPRTTCASAVQDTILLRLKRDPLIALARRYPDLALALVNVLSVRLREAQERIAELTRTRPQALHKLYDELG